MNIADTSIEGRLLGNIILQPEVWYEVATDFNADLFSDSTYQQIAQVMKELYQDGKKPSSIALTIEFRKRKLGITANDLTSLTVGHVTSKETRRLLDELTDLYKRRTVYQTLLTTLDSLQSSDKETDELIAESQQAMIDAFSQANKAQLTTMQDLCEKLFIEQQRLQQGEKPAIYPLKLKGLQDLVGGIETGALVILAARPSMGKTAYILSECIGWGAKGLPGIVFSLEQKDTQIGQRNLASIQEMPVSYLRGKLDDYYLDKFNTGLSKMRDLPILISDKRGLTVDQICSIARLEKMKNPAMKWIVIDYLTAISMPGNQPQHLKVGDVVLKLRNLAEEIDVFVVLLSQLNRGVETRTDKRPTKADLRDSGNIEEYADVILFLYREGYYHPGFLGAEMGDWITEIEVAKNRQGGNDGMRTLAMFRKPYMQWIDCPSDWAEKYQAHVTKRKYGG